jgi:hypothetical protein
MGTWEWRGAKGGILPCTNFKEEVWKTKEIEYKSPPWMENERCCKENKNLTPKGRRPFFGLFLEFGQPIVDAIFVQKVSKSWWTCGLVLASRRTNFYKIPIFVQQLCPKNKIILSCGQLRATKKLLILKLFWVGFFFINF